MTRLNDAERQTSDPRAPGALDGVRVVDLTRHIPGPYGTLLLGALGADVIKVEEPPLGDATRAVPPAVDGESVAFSVLNRNKRSIVVDLRQPQGVEAVRRLAASADVFIEGFRPGTLARRGLGADDLRRDHPRLIYCSLSGYGPEGPLASRAGHDINYAARAGLLDTVRGAGGEPHLAGFQPADMAGGMLAVIAILAALQARERTGEGQAVDVSLFGAALATMTVPAARALAGGERPDELSGTYACYRVYRCRDGRHVSVGALEPKFWEALCDALELPELKARQWQKAARRGETAARLAEVFATRDRDEWVEHLAGRDVCVEPVLDPYEALAQPQAAPYVTDTAVGGQCLRSVGVPFRLAATPARPGHKAPAPGEHSDELLAGAGYSPDEVEALRTGGVIT